MDVLSYSLRRWVSPIQGLVGSNDGCGLSCGIFIRHDEDLSPLHFGEGLSTGSLLGGGGGQLLWAPGRIWELASYDLVQR
jgi:hypothetical protein